MNDRIPVNCNHCGANTTYPANDFGHQMADTWKAEHACITTGQTAWRA